MAFVKPYNYVDGTVLSGANQQLNDDAAKKYINQGIVFADYADSNIDFDQIQSGELQPITNQYRFVSGEVLGQAVDKEVVNRAYFTSNIKTGRQTADNPLIYQSIYSTGQTLYLSSTADILITFGGTFISSENEVEGKGKWDSKIALRYRDSTSNNWQTIEGTRSYSFEETTAATAAPRDATDTSLLLAAGYGDTVEAFYCLRRWSGWTWIVKGLPAGEYSFIVMINAKVEQGYSSARSFTCEVFYG
tara:strand:+ start:1068 stop:1808 length:741 start_codon:yes stop_codon:yes gene_type:complete